MTRGLETKKEWYHRSSDKDVKEEGGSRPARSQAERELRRLHWIKQRMLLVTWKKKGEKNFLMVTMPDHELLECRNIVLILFLASLLKEPSHKLVDSQFC